MFYDGFGCSSFQNDHVENKALDCWTHKTPLKSFWFISDSFLVEMLGLKIPVKNHDTWPYISPYLHLIGFYHPVAVVITGWEIRPHTLRGMNCMLASSLCLHGLLCGTLWQLSFEAWSLGPVFMKQRNCTEECVSALSVSLIVLAKSVQLVSIP